MRRDPSKPQRASKPPPCAQKCWEYVDKRAGGWLYTDSVFACGHVYDADSGTWRWHGHPTLPQRDEGTRVSS